MSAVPLPGYGINRTSQPSGVTAGVPSCSIAANGTTRSGDRATLSARAAWYAPWNGFAFPPRARDRA